MQRETRKPKGPGGRPPLPKTKKRSKRVMANFTQAEWRRIRESFPDELSDSRIVRELAVPYLRPKGDKQ